MSTAKLFNPAWSDPPSPEVARRAAMPSGVFLRGSDGALARPSPAVREDDEATVLYRRLRPTVMGTLRKLLDHGDPDMEDLAQQAMLAVVEGMDRHRGDGSLEAWVSNVSASVVYKHARRRKTERRSGHSAAAKDLLGRVKEHLDGMHEANAWTYLLHDVCGYSLRDVATITEVSVPAAQARLVRGRGELHARIAGDPELTGALEELGDG